MAREQQNQSSWSLLTILLVAGGVGFVLLLMCGGVAAMLFLPAIDQARTAARRAQSQNNLKQIGLALHNFHLTQSHFPEGTVPNPALPPEKRLSWIVGLLPYLDQAPAYSRMDLKQAWDSPPNDVMCNLQFPVLENPNVPMPPNSQYGISHYVGIAGLGTDAATLPLDDKRAGVFGYDRVVRMVDIEDGTANTLAVSWPPRPVTRPAL